MQFFDTNKQNFFLNFHNFTIIIICFDELWVALARVGTPIIWFIPNVNLIHTNCNLIHTKLWIWFIPNCEFDSYQTVNHIHTKQWIIFIPNCESDSYQTVNQIHSLVLFYLTNKTIFLVKQERKNFVIQNFLKKIKK